MGRKERHFFKYLTQGKLKSYIKMDSSIKLVLSWSVTAALVP